MFNVYAVSVRVSLINDVTSGLMGMSRLFGRVHGNAVQLQQALHRISLTAAAGAGLMGIGGAGLFALQSTIKPANEYAHQLAQMNIAGMKHVEIQDAIRAGWNATLAMPTQSISKNLGDIKELRSVLGTAQEAINALPTMIQLQGVLSNVKGVSDAKGTAYEVAKTLDLRGAALDPAEFQRQAQAMTKAMVMAGGNLGAGDFFGTVKYGRTAAQGWSNDFLYEIAPTLIQAMKSSGGSGGGAGGPGNALMTAFSTVVGGKIAQKNLGTWQSLGLLDPSKIVWNKVGSAKGIAPGGVAGSAEFQKNPFLWAQNYLAPALASHGIKTASAQQATIARLFGTRTEAQVMTMMTVNPKMFTRDQGLIRGAQGLEAYETLRKKDPYLAQQAMAAQWENLMTRIGIVVMPAVLDVTLKLVDGMTALSKAMGEHPTLVKALVIAFAGLSAITFVTGLLLTLGAAVGAFGLLFGAAGAGSVAAVGLSLLGTGIGALVAPLAALALTPFGLIAIGLGLVVGGLIAAKGLIEKTNGAAYANPAMGAKDPKTGKAEVLGYYTPYGFTPAYPDHPTVKAKSALGHGPAAERTGGSPLVPAGGSAQKMSFTGDVHMDGRKVGQVVWQHQNRDLERSSRQSTPSVDPGMSLAPVASGYRAT